MPAKPDQASRDRGSRWPRPRITRFRTTAASPTRSATRVKGGSSRSATPAKKKEPPQRMESVISSAQSVAVIVVGMAGFMRFVARLGSSLRRPHSVMPLRKG